MHRRAYAVFRRNETKGVPIVLKDAGDVGLWVDRGVVEFLAEVGVAEPNGNYAVDRLFVDLDPQNGYPLDSLKELAFEVHRRVSRHPWVDAERTYLHWTGGKGFHVVGHFRGDQPREVEKVKSSLDGLVANLCDDVSVFREALTAIYEPYAVLDLSPVMRRGVYRNAFTFHSAAGGICVPVRPARLKEFDPEKQGSVEWVSDVAARVDVAGAGTTFDELVRGYWAAEE